MGTFAAFRQEEIYHSLGVFFASRMQEVARSSEELARSIEVLAIVETQQGGAANLSTSVFSA
jgi:hypothetical protein